MNTNNIYESLADIKVREVTENGETYTGITTLEYSRLTIYLANKYHNKYHSLIDDAISWAMDNADVEGLPLVDSADEAMRFLVEMNNEL